MSANEKPTSSMKNSYLSFLKNAATFHGDLSTLTAPPFVLSPQSITEFSAYWAEHPSLLIAPALETDPENRALLVLRWFISTLRTQHHSKDENGKTKGMKPLNPFLGEVFKGTWVDGEGKVRTGRTELVAEQVCHHPPATAFRVWNEEHGISLHGHIKPKAYFSGTVHIDRKGYALLHVAKYNESYLINMPKIHMEGLFTFSPAPELSGTTYIRSSSGYTTKIDYMGRKWLKGQSNSFVANIYHDSKGAGRESLYTAEGQWNGIYTVKDNRTANEVMSFDINKQKKTPLSIRPIEEQHPLEARRAWRDVMQSIKEGDIVKVGSSKSKLENEQREMRKQEKNEGREFERRYFSQTDNDPMVEELVNGLPLEARIAEEVDVEHGFWLWDEEKFRRVQREEEEEIRMRSQRPRFDSAVSGLEVDGMSEFRV